MAVILFEQTDFRVFLKAWINDQSTKRGLKSDLANAMKVSSSFLSQVLKGEKSLTPEQAADAADWLGFTDAETDYWFLLVESDRAGTPKLKARLARKLALAREQSKNLPKRVRVGLELDEKTKSVFYSSWIYLAVRNLSALDDVNDVNQVARRLGLPPAVVAKVVAFLLETGLCRQENGALTYGPAKTFLERESPYTPRHHFEWRRRAAHAMDRRRDEDFFFTAPMSLSRAAMNDVRETLLQSIREVYDKVGPSTSERVACLNIDWFDFTNEEERG